MLHRHSSALALLLPVATACGDPQGSCPDAPQSCSSEDGTTIGSSSAADESSSSHDESESSSSHDDSESSTDTGDTATDPGAPLFLAFGVNSTALLEGETLVFSAVLTDPDGIDDIVGGTLLDPASSATYGAFATSASEGAYELSLAWNDLEMVQSIDAPQSGIERPFRAEFFDTAGHVAVREVSVQLDCAAESDGLCGGECRDFAQSNTNCGGCGHVCFADTFPLERECGDGRCYGTFHFNGGPSCAVACGSLGFECGSPPTSPNVGFASTTQGDVVLASCDQQPPTGTTGWIECWCREP